MKSQAKLNIQENIELAPYTTMKIGGPARYFAEVSDEESLIAALDFAEEKNLEFFVLGGGSNIIVSDQGFDGLVIKLKFKSEKLKATTQNSKFTLECWSGDSLASVVSFARDNSFTGLEWAVGIPGTVGGAVRGNAGAYGADMSGILQSVRVIEMTNDKSREIQSSKLKIQNCNSKSKTYTIDECKFSYRNSIFKQNKNLIILSCVLGLENGEKAAIEEKMRENIEKRTEKIPKESSAGSFFENPVVMDKDLIARFEKDKGAACRDSKLPAGWLIDEAGLRGKKIGNVQVSEKHGNFIVNLGSGRAQDVIMLSSLIKQKIRHEFNIQLKEEIIYLGF